MSRLDRGGSGWAPRVVRAGVSDRELNRFMRYRVARPGWRDRWAVVRETAAEALTLVGLIAVVLFVFIAATVR